MLCVKMYVKKSSKRKGAEIVYITEVSADFESDFLLHQIQWRLAGNKEASWEAWLVYFGLVDH